MGSFRTSPAAGALLVLLYCLLAVAPLGVATLVRPSTYAGFLPTLGMHLALVGFPLLALQYFLASRWRWLERPFGLDMVMLFHRVMGVFLVFLLLAHPVLVATGGAGLALFFRLEVPFYIWAGRLALVLLLAHVAVSVFRQTLRLSFERWRLLHDALALVLLGTALVHSWNAGSDLGLQPLRSLWLGLPVLAGLTLLWQRFACPWLCIRRPYRVVEVKPEAANVWTLEMEPPEGEKVPDYLPGQFHFLTLQRGRGLPEEEHHFTISSTPTREGRVSSTIKGIGDFTRTIGQTRPGDAVGVDGPFGRFSYLLHSQNPDLVFIAGGIGITPLMAMLRHLRDTRSDRSVLLLYASRKEEEIVFSDELEQIRAGGHSRLTVVHVITRPEGEWPGERGYIDREKLQRYAGAHIGRAEFYVCGPPVMSKKVLADLRALGVPRENLHTEVFSLSEGGPSGSGRGRTFSLVTGGVMLVLLAAAVLAAFLRSGGT